jgi:hypothetical protein
LTTFLNYGEVAHQRQGEIMQGLMIPSTGQSSVDALAEALAKKLWEKEELKSKTAVS